MKKITFLCILGLCGLQLTAKPKANKSHFIEINSHSVSKTVSIFFFKGLDSILKKSTTSTLKNSDLEFSRDTIENRSPVSVSIVKNRDLAAASFKKIEDEGAWVDKFTNEDIQELPIGIKHTNKGENNDNVEYAIGITEATFTKDYTELTVFARVKLPQTNSNGYPIELFFGANNVKLSHQGGIVGFSIKMHTKSSFNTLGLELHYTMG